MAPQMPKIVLMVQILKKQLSGIANKCVSLHLNSTAQ